MLGTGTERSGRIARRRATTARNSEPMARVRCCANRENRRSTKPKVRAKNRDQKQARRTKATAMESSKKAARGEGNCSVRLPQRCIILGEECGVRKQLRAAWGTG